jgi:hypothetical protein
MQQLEGEASVTPKEERMLQLDDVRLELWVEYHHVLQNFNLYFSLLIKFRLISDYFEGNHFPFFMIKGLKNLSKRALPKGTHDFISICNCIAD